jgi:hypothetical protein
MDRRSQDPKSQWAKSQRAPEITILSGPVAPISQLHNHHRMVGRPFPLGVSEPCFENRSWARNRRHGRTMRVHSANPKNSSRRARNSLEGVEPTPPAVPAGADLRCGRFAGACWCHTDRVVDKSKKRPCRCTHKRYPLPAAGRRRDSVSSSRGAGLCFWGRAMGDTRPALAACQAGGG